MLPTETCVSNGNCGGGRKSVVDRAQKHPGRQQDSATTHTHSARRPCCSQGYAHCPRALHQPLPPSRLLSQPCACRHRPSTPPALLCAMPRTRPRELPTLQRTVLERDWVLRRVEVCGNHSQRELYTCTYTHDLFLLLQFYNEHTHIHMNHHQQEGREQGTDSRVQNNT